MRIVERENSDAEGGARGNFGSAEFFGRRCTHRGHALWQTHDEGRRMAPTQEHRYRPFRVSALSQPGHESRLAVEYRADRRAFAHVLIELVAGALRFAGMVQRLVMGARDVVSLLVEGMLETRRHARDYRPHSAPP